MEKRAEKWRDGMRTEKETRSHTQILTYNKLPFTIWLIKIAWKISNIIWYFKSKLDGIAVKCGLWNAQFLHSNSRQIYIYLVAFIGNYQFVALLICYFIECMSQYCLNKYSKTADTRNKEQRVSNIINRLFVISLFTFCHLNRCDSIKSSLRHAIHAAHWVFATKTNQLNVICKHN